MPALSRPARKELYRLRCCGLPAVLLQIVAACFICGLIEGQPPLDGVEFFAGKKAVTCSLRRHGLRIASYEYEDDAVYQDILSPRGFAAAVSLCMRVVPGGIVWFGIVCSSWVWICRATSGRSGIDPHGNCSPFVLAGNIMVSRVMLLMRLAMARCCMCILEQPGTSLMHLHARFQEMIRVHLIYNWRTCLGYFGGETAKALVLFSNMPHLPELGEFAVCRTLPTTTIPVTIRTYDEDGRLRVSGGVALKGTQTYPAAFGRAVALVYTRHMVDIKAFAVQVCHVEPVAEITLDMLVGRPADLWVDARLVEVLDVLVR